MSISKEKKLSPMFECWTANRVWTSFLFLTTWKLSDLFKIKFIENEKKVFKKENQQKEKLKRKEEEKKRNLSPDEIWTCVFGREKQRKYWINPLDHASKPWKGRLKTGTYSISTMIDSFQELKFLGFLYNYGIFNWGCEWGQPTNDKGLKIFSDYRQNE